MAPGEFVRTQVQSNGAMQTGNLPPSDPRGEGDRLLARRLRGVILLAGSLRATDLVRAAGRPLLELPLTHGRNVMSQWTEACTALSRAMGVKQLPVRIMVDQHSRAAATPAHPPDIRVHVEIDKADYRGTAGILLDLSKDYGDDDWVLVANANQVMLDDLTSLARDLAQTRADVAILAHADGSPMGLSLIRPAVMRAVKNRGFMDFKEQILHELSGRFDVRVVIRPTATGLPIREGEGYIAALRAWHLAHGAGEARSGALPGEEWFSVFALSEAGAKIGAGVRIHDSVVLDGARVGDGCVIVRSVLCAGAVVPPASVVADRIVADRFDTRTAQDE